MAMPREQIQMDFVEAWRTFTASMEKSLEDLEKDINEAAEMTSICTDEWCEATEHVIDELGNALFSISEPRWSTDEDSKKIRELRKRLHDLYANYKAAAKR
jgi:phosphopentomutase